ncbi:hypothetical protein FPV67DRAFT_1225181 [Lyophyllum atratum]|nr:hypothetical protein FPV67DRAFT_1225181 [Lyophyllum atratum]
MVLANTRITSLPTEVLLETARTLEPADLLALSRVSKQFRAIFMSKHSRLVWVSAFKNAIADLGLPVGCPADMNEPQYASLIFDQFCSACNSTRATKVHFPLRLRFCATCEALNLKQGIKIAIPPWMEKNNVQIWSCLPVAFYSSGSMTPFSWDNHTWHHYSVTEYNHVAQEYCELKGDKGALEKYVRDREEMATLMMQHGFLLTRWNTAKMEARAEKRKATMIASKRKEVISRITRSTRKASSTIAVRETAA